MARSRKAPQAADAPADVPADVPTNATASTTASASPKIPRPPNAWIMYRCAKLVELRTQEPQAVHHMQNVSTVLSTLWKAEPREVVDEWRALAKEAAAKHAEMYPEYKFMPQKKEGKVHKQKGRKAAEMAASMAAVQANKKAQVNRGRRASTPPPPFAAPSSSTASPRAPSPSVPTQMEMLPATATPSGHLWHPNPAIPANPTLSSNPVPSSSSTPLPAPFPSYPAPTLMPPTTASPSGYSWYPNATVPTVPTNVPEPQYGPSMFSSVPGGSDLAPQDVEKPQGEPSFDMNDCIDYPLDEQKGDGAVAAATPGLGLSLYPSQDVDDGELRLPIEFGSAGGHTAGLTMTDEQFNALMAQGGPMLGSAGFDPRAYDFDAFPLFGSHPVEEGPYHTYGN